MFLKIFTGTMPKLTILATLSVKIMYEISGNVGSLEVTPVRWNQSLHTINNLQGRFQLRLQWIAVCLSTGSLYIILFPLLIMSCQLALATNIEMYKKLTVYYLHIKVGNQFLSRINKEGCRKCKKAYHSSAIWVSNEEGFDCHNLTIQ